MESEYDVGFRYGRRDARYERLYGRMPFVCSTSREVRSWSRANAHRKPARSHRAHWLGYARGLSA